MFKEDIKLHGGPWNRAQWMRLHKPRSRRWVKATTILMSVLVAFRLFSSVLTHRRALREKFTPTIYTRLFPDDGKRLASTRWKWEQPVNYTDQSSYSRAELWESREEWKWLGSGAEGDAYTYNGNVIKVFKTARFPYRNCVPDVSPDLRWPTEVSASILLGGMAESQTMEDARFLPVVDYFLSPSSEKGPLRWHFVTPLMRSGNLNKLSKHLREQEHAYTAHELDVMFRPSVEQLLDTLHLMHTQYGLCHDDIKPDNIFLATSYSLNEIGENMDQVRHWVLADLGNVRELRHPYHSSILWSGINDNLRDCRTNDVMRILKSYMLFLRASVDDVTAFNEQFLYGDEPWSRFFWKGWESIQSGDPVSADDAILFSISNSPSDFEESNVTPERNVVGFANPVSPVDPKHEDVMAQTVTNVLKYHASDMTSRVWGLVSILGIPVGRCDVESYG